MEGIIQVSRLFIYDTSNFIDFPIGGQLTSIGNFLRYVCEEHPERVKDIMLVGVTLCPEEIGRVKRIELYGQQIGFLAVAAAEGDLGNTSRSLRLMYVKGLLRFGRMLKLTKRDCNYIHTPEAYGVVKLFSFRTPCVIFSHGSYFNMERGFRFFQKNLLVKKGFTCYLKWLLKTADRILLLDRDSLRDYGPYNSNLVRVSNSIVCPELPEGCRRLKSGRVEELLFVGRLSRDKRVEPIIRAVTEAGSDEVLQGVRLTVVGSGEEYNRLIPYEGDQVHFTGAVAPKEVRGYMEKADILVMNSVFEGVPMTILEAVSMGLPVISTNVGGIGEVLRFGQDSEETDGTPEGIRQAVRRIAAAYEVYSKNAYENSGAYDYRRINKRVYGLLCDYWR